MSLKRQIGRPPARGSRFQKVVTQTRVEQDLRRQLALGFHDAAQRPWCAICHEPRTDPLHAHHWVEHSFLRRELKAKVDPLRMLAIGYDARNASGICERCHGAHHGPSVESPLTRNHIPESAWEFARELDQFVGDERFTVRLERYREAA